MCSSNILLTSVPINSKLPLRQHALLYIGIYKNKKESNKNNKNE